MGFVYVFIIVELILNFFGLNRVAFLFGEVAIIVYMIHSLYTILKEKIREKRYERENKVNPDQKTKVKEEIENVRDRQR
ncbi:MAG: hypothetical protein IKR56_07810 [Lachnospiraceae bacterium]|nr:hypothetical protein [Lachnospiraceae bacterium]